jgi:hypothetical protein
MPPRRLRRRKANSYQQVERTALGEGVISMMWDQVKVAMPFTVIE